jgi:hypothetical protein
MNIPLLSLWSSSVLSNDISLMSLVSDLFAQHFLCDVDVTRVIV